MAFKFPVVGVSARVEGAGAFVNDMTRMAKSTNAAAITMASATAKVNATQGNMFQRATDGALAVGRAIQSVGRSLSLIGTTFTFTFSLPIIAGFTSIIKSGMEFETQLTRLFGVGGLNNGVLDPKLYQRVKVAIQDIARTTGVATSELVKASYEAASIGLNIEESIALTRSAAELAVATGGDVTEIGRSLAFAVTNNLDDAANRLKLINELGNKFVVFIRESAIELENIGGSAFNSIYAQAKLLGVAENQLLALISAISITGIPQERIITSLTAIMRQFVAPTKKFKDSIATIGLSLADLQAQIKDQGLVKTLRDLHDQLGQEAFFGIFTQLAVRAGLAPLELQAVMDAVLSTEGELVTDITALVDSVRAQQNTLQGQFNILRAALEVAGQEIFDVFKPQIIEVVGKLTDYINRLIDLIRENPDTTLFFVKLAAGLALLGPSLLLIGQFIRAFGLLFNILFLPLQLVGGAIGLVTGLAGTIVREVAPAFNLMNKALGLFGRGWAVMTSVLVRGLGTFTNVKKGLAGLGNGLFKLSGALLDAAKNSKLTDVIAESAIALGRAFGVAGKAAGKIFSANIKKAFEAIGDSGFGKGITEKLAGFIKTDLATLGKLKGAVSEALSSVFGGVGDVAARFAYAMAEAIDVISGSALDGLVRAFSAVVPTIEGTAVQIALIIGSIGRPLKAVASELIDSFGPAFYKIGQDAIGVGQKIKGVFLSFAREAAASNSEVSRFATAFASKIGGAVSTALDQLQLIGIGLASTMERAFVFIGTGVADLVKETIFKFQFLGLQIAESFVGQGVGKIGGALSGIGAEIVKTLGFIGQTAKGTLSGLLKSVRGFGGGLVSELGKTFSFAGSIIGDSVSAIAGGANGLLHRLGATMFTVFGDLGKTAQNAFSSVLSGFSGLASGLAAIAGGPIGAVVSSVASQFANLAVKVGGSLLLMGIKIQALIIVAAGLGYVFTQAYKSVQKAANDFRVKTSKTFSSIGKDMLAHGKNIIVQFSNGMIQGAIAVVQALQYIANLITFYLEAHSPPKILPDLREWGSGAVAAYMEGWTTIDLSLFKDLASTFENYISSIFEGDQEGRDLAINQALIKLKPLIAQAIAEINNFGSATSATMAEIYASVQGGTLELRNYVDAMIDLATASENVKNIQQQIAEINYRYDEKLRPLNEAYDKLEQQRSQIAGGNRLQELADIMADPRAPAFIKQLASIESQQITIDIQRGQLEADRDAELSPLQQQLDAATRQEELLQQQLDIAQAQFDLQVDQNELLQKIADALSSQADAASVDTPSGPEGINPEPVVGGVPATPIPQINTFDPANLPAGWGGTGSNGEGPGQWFSAPTMDEMKANLEKQAQELYATIQNIGSNLKARLLALYTDTIKPILDGWNESQGWKDLKEALDNIVQMFLDLADIDTGDKTKWEVFGDIVQIIINVLAFVAKVTEKSLAWILPFVQRLIDLVTGIGDKSDDIAALGDFGNTWKVFFGLFTGKNTIADNINAFVDAITALGLKLQILKDFLEIIGAPFKAAGNAAMVFTSPGTLFADLVGGLINQSIRMNDDPNINKATDWPDLLKQKFMDLYDNVIGHSSVPDLVNGIIMWFGILVAAVIVPVETMIENIRTAFESLRTIASEKWEAIKTAIGTAFDAAKTWVVQTAEDIKTGVMEKIDALGIDLADAFQKIKTTVTEKWDAMWLWIKTTVSKKVLEVQTIVEWLHTEWNRIWQLIKDSVQGIIDEVTRVFQEIWQSASDKLQPVIDWIGDVWDALLNFWNWLHGKSFDIVVNADIPNVPAAPEVPDAPPAAPEVPDDNRPLPQEDKPTRNKTAAYLMGDSAAKIAEINAGVNLDSFHMASQMVDNIYDKLVRLQSGINIPIHIISDAPVYVEHKVTIGDTYVNNETDRRALENFIRKTVIEMALP